MTARTPSLALCALNQRCIHPAMQNFTVVNKCFEYHHVCSVCLFVLPLCSAG